MIHMITMIEISHEGTKKRNGIKVKPSLRPATEFDEKLNCENEMRQDLQDLQDGKIQKKHPVHPVKKIVLKLLCATFENILTHLMNIFRYGELDEDSVAKLYLATA